jgi:hypothetical protein
LLLAVVIIVIVAGIGYAILTASHAATPFTNGYATSGTTSGTTSVVTGGSSPAGTALTFGTIPSTGSSTGGCSSGGVVAPCIGGATTGASGWGTPVFDDEFTTDSMLNTKLWAPVWFSNGSTSNGTAMDSSNVSVSGGYLNLEATTNGTGGLVSTNPSDGVSGHTGFQYAYGYAEAKIYLPASGSSIANWPAWWTDGQAWPEDGEQDIMEGLGGSACYHFHYGTGSGSSTGGCGSGSYTGWHTFGADWASGIVTYYYDGVKVGTTTAGITSESQYLILENSTGSDSGPIVTPADMMVAYVRVWQ